jgi:hypothetical protein
MPQYLLSVYHPDNYKPSSEDAAMIEEIHALNREMIAAGVRIFAGGLSPASNAKLQRAQTDGGVLITDGPYLETKEHLGVFGYWKPLTWTRRWRGRARAPSPVGCRSRCESYFFDQRLATERRRCSADQGK